MLYRWKVALLNTRVGFRVARATRKWVHDRLGRGPALDSYHRLPEYIQARARGKSFVDVGCMWGVNGEYAFVAEEAGATRVKGIDVFGPTPEFEATHRERSSDVEFILGDATDPAVIGRVGEVDVVFCAGVLYHHPSPFDLLVALRHMCRETLILRTSTIPEMPGTRNMAVYWPMLTSQQRRQWGHKRLWNAEMLAITTPFVPAEGYGNCFWGMTPSCVAALLQTAGFRPVYHATEPWADTFICEAVEAPFEHKLPGRERAE
jgi:2-polyprenyl-3-methyl-5-hydroxy-6-metoxy-1,4-benzoquinol methylase